MHELSLARYLINAVEGRLGPEDNRVLRVYISLGSAAGIAPDSLRFAFHAVANGTRMDGAELSIVEVLARSRCANCSIIFEFKGMLGYCPNCGRLGGELLSGDEMILSRIEVADV